jgi:phosphotransacetylase
MKVEPDIIKNTPEIIEFAQEIGWKEPMKLGVVSADDSDVLEAVLQAKAEHFVSPILIGETDKIKMQADKMRLDLEDTEIIHTSNEMESAYKAAEMASNNEVQIIMKGFIQTSVLLKAILDPKFKLRLSFTLSHCALLSIPGYHKLLNITDGGMIFQPTLEQKIAILKNAILVANALGVKRPKIALHSATDFVNPNIASTLDCAILAKMGQRKQLGEVDIDGPITLDCALMPNTAKDEGIDSPIAGDVDILLVSSIEEGNILAKSLVYYSGAAFSGVVVGAKVPISLVSRTDSSFNKKSSIALAVILADYIQKMQSKIA